MTNLSSYIKYSRKKLKLTQEDLANKAGVGIRFIRELEHGKQTLRLDKVNVVLSLFGSVLFPSKIAIDPFEIALNFTNNATNRLSKAVKIILKNKTVKNGYILKEIFDSSENKINEWIFVSNINALKYIQTKNEKLLENILHSDIQEIEEQL